MMKRLSRSAALCALLTLVCVLLCGCFSSSIISVRQNPSTVTFSAAFGPEDSPEPQPLLLSAEEPDSGLPVTGVGVVFTQKEDDLYLTDEETVDDPILSRFTRTNAGNPLPNVGDKLFTKGSSYEQAYTGSLPGDGMKEFSVSVPAQYFEYGKTYYFRVYLMNVVPESADYLYSVVGSFTFDQLGISSDKPDFLTTCVYEMKSEAGKGGTVIPCGDFFAQWQSDFSYRFIPEEGFAVADVIVDGQSVGAVAQYAFEDVQAPHTISVSFVKK